MIIEQFNIEAAFLNGPIQEEIYIKDPHATGKRAWRLQKALYGLKQAARNWNLMLNDILKGMGFEQCPDDPGLYTSEDKLLCVHVDDLLCAFVDEVQKQRWLNALAKFVTIEERGVPSKFLGMNIKWDEKCAMITGEDAIEKLATLYNIKKARSPFSLAKPSHSSGEVGRRRYQAITGSLLFIARMWRPDIRYVVARLCTKTSQPSHKDIHHAEKVVGYLLSTKNDGICLQPMTGKIEVFCDAGEETLEDKATTGVIVMDGQSPLSWTARKQDVTTLSSTEAEYIALSSAAQDALWFTKVMEFIGISHTPTVFTDNEGAATLSENPDFHCRTKHIRRRHHFVRECVENGELMVKWIPGEQNPADMLTKPVTGTRLTALKRLTGMIFGMPGTNDKEQRDGPGLPGSE